MLAPTWVLACFSGQGQQHLSCEEMFSLQYVCLTELCPTAPGVGPQSTGLLGSPAGGWGVRVGWSNRAFVLATCFGRVRCHWEDYGTVVRSPDREGRRGKRFSQGTRVSPGGSPHAGAPIPCSLLTPPSLLLEGLSLGLSLPEWCCIRLRDSLKHLTSLGDSFCLLAIGQGEGEPKPHVCSAGGSTNRVREFFFSEFAAVELVVDGLAHPGR